MTVLDPSALSLFPTHRLSVCLTFGYVTLLTFLVNYSVIMSSYLVDPFLSVFVIWRLQPGSAVSCSLLRLDVQKGVMLSPQPVNLNQMCDLAKKIHTRIQWTLYHIWAFLIPNCWQFITFLTVTTLCFNKGTKHWLVQGREHRARDNIFLPFWCVSQCRQSNYQSLW